MCTSITLKSVDGHHMLGRTMDFAFELEGRPVVIPRAFKWQTDLGQSIVGQYAFIGIGRNVGKYLVADGVNEKGFSIAELYFPNEAKYTSQMSRDCINLAPHEFIFWALGEVETIAELREKISKISLIDTPVALLSTVVPLHYIAMDRTGETVVIETNNGHIQIKNNPVGVMANSPEFEWHLKNLNNYLSLQPQNRSGRLIGDYQSNPLGQGSGSYGLPGGNTSPERFVRAVFNRQFTEREQSTPDTVNNMFHILASVSMSKGVNLKDDGSIDYTQYRVVFDTSDLVVYFSPYDRQDVFSVKLSEALCEEKQPIEFLIPKGFEATSLN